MKAKEWITTNEGNYYDDDLLNITHAELCEKMDEFAEHQNKEMIE